MKYRELGKTGYKVSVVGYGGVVSSQHFDKAVIPGDGQKMSDRFVSWAVEQGINYFDVAPGYGDAQLLMGNSLIPYRRQIYLACKTNQRKRAGAESDLKESLRLLHTDYFDVYQLHGLSTMDELETCFGKDGAMGLLESMKKNGDARHIGFTAHSEAVALRALELFDFDTVMFPFNWHMNMAHDMGKRLIKAAKEKGAGILGIKSMIERAWHDEEERYGSPYPKSWCRPFDIQTESSFLLSALRFTDSLGVDVLIPPGNFDHLQFAVTHVDDFADKPLSDNEHDALKDHLPEVTDYPFYDPDCYRL
ncbi:MAG: aldo/keto reductase [Lachnospiraceae bacterium]|nr:aldo/keto reductase [Lachnospiraceae bacterium]